MAYRSGLIVGLSMVLVSLVMLGGSACSSSSSSTTPATTGDGGIAVSADVCKKTGNYDACFSCCNQPVGYANARLTFDACMCQGPCKTPCADSVCSVIDASAPQSNACETCLDSDPSAKGCSAQASTVCDNDPSCARFTQCVNAACNGLPAGDGGH